MSLCKTLLIAICFIAATSAFDTSCLVLAGGRLFNLCPFKDPITVPFDVLPIIEGGLDFNFSLTTNNVPNCLDGTANMWLTISSPDPSVHCGYGARPTYSLTKQELDLHILKITYQRIDMETDKVEVNLYCNPKGEKNNKVDFFVNMLEPHTLSLSGYSYYGCPVPASTSDDGFLSMRKTQL